MDAIVFKAQRWIPVYALLALVALVTAALVLSTAPPVHGQGENDPAVSFSPGTISPKVYTVGVRANQTFTNAPDQGLPKLPEATLTNAPANTIGYAVKYAATGLPAGLTIGQDRVIRGIPTTPTVGNAVLVTYTATITAYVDPDNDGDYDDLTSSTYTNSLTFQVGVSPAVTFSEEAMAFINFRIIAFISNSWENATLPQATGGGGALTYSLLENNSGRPLADVADGITFNAATRTIGGTPAAAAQKRWAVTYVAEDPNGGRASGYTVVYVGGYGGL